MNETEVLTNYSDTYELVNKHVVYPYVKRTLDIFIALGLTLILIPLYLIVGLAIKMEDGGPVFYKPMRSGKNGTKFAMYKFRSMIVATEENGKQLVHEQRITKIGRVLRKTSIDELPQIINVLKGEMSIIGPRPWILPYYENMNEIQRHRCDVLPGITGLAQANGRNGLNVFEKINYDLEYVKNVSFKMDLSIIWQSIAIVFKRGHAEIIQEDMFEEIKQLKEQD